MGRRKIDDDKKKTKIGVSIDPEIPKFLKDRSINISSLVNKLLKNYMENANKNLF